MTEELKPCVVLFCKGRARPSAALHPEMCARHARFAHEHGSLVGARAPAGAPLRWLQEVALKHDSDECLMWPYYRTKKGYGFMFFDGRKHFASRVICVLTQGPAPEGRFEAAHSCGVPGCVSPKHIRWLTPKENTLDKIAHGTYAVRSSRYGKNRLNAARVQAIRAAALAGRSNADIAKEHAISEFVADCVITRKWWGWIP